ncbi:hypothetical protein BGZ70_007608 [Mortierella alpina]|uniref:Uncharacterized protein n=1 Tax=Mortierella alpina TaxID=64518 RepID=A0A9P6J5E5_MORAP|nr:hypothetical protein BGZ70_007608 [Mortierella alpina]
MLAASSHGAATPVVAPAVTGSGSVAPSVAGGSSASASPMGIIFCTHDGDNKASYGDILPLFFDPSMIQELPAAFVRRPVGR